jgi:hypothetical protein
MKNIFNTCVIISLLVLSLSAYGSEEDYMIWKQVKIRTAGNKETGEVSFAAQTDGKTFKSISITAFKKQFKLAKADLAKIKGFPLSSLTITHEAGYVQLGGHTVHFKMKRVYYRLKKLVEGRVRISISKGKGLEVHGPEIKEIKGTSKPVIPPRP